jgi:hypothetical protein
MKEDLRKNAKFHATLSKLIDNFHQQLRQEGFNLKVSQLRFQSQDDFCPCGVEHYQDPQTGEWKTRCVRCPPAQRLKTMLLATKTGKTKKKKGI